MQIKLRQTAEQRLKEGTAPVTRGLPIGPQALTLLHDLASAPETAGDALKLLHELQVHQVELDLQYEHAEQERQRLEDELRNYTALFYQPPFAYVKLGIDGLLLSANRMAADWFAPNMGEGQDLAGRRIGELLAPESQVPIRDLLARLRIGESKLSCAMESSVGGVSAQVVAAAAPGLVLMAFIPLQREPIR